MNFDDYQKAALTTDAFAGQPQTITSPAFFSNLLGLFGETGEIAEKFKKIYRDKNNEFTDEDRIEIEKELGDILWYLGVVSSYLDISLQSVAEKNIAKLKSRQNRGVISGSGDNR